MLDKPRDVTPDYVTQLCNILDGLGNTTSAQGVAVRVNLGKTSDKIQEAVKEAS